MANEKTKEEEKKKENEEVKKESDEAKEDQKTSDSTDTSSDENKPEAQWYVLMAKSGRENKIVDALKQRIKATGLEDVIQEVMVPVQKKIVVKDGEQQIKEDRIFPGYVLIKMVLDKSTWEIITSTDGVSGFVRTTKYPRPLPEEEVQAIMKFMELEQPAFKAGFAVGDAVKIKEGAFADFVGSVNEIDETKGKVKVLISIFGRETPVELEFDQVDKL
jgi:transcriptional antiterminator NusG